MGSMYGEYGIGMTGATGDAAHSLSGATAIMPSPMKVYGPRPDSALHPQAIDYRTITASTQAAPAHAPKVIDLANGPEVVGFTVMVVLVLFPKGVSMWIAWVWDKLDGLRIRVELRLQG
jgi:hypothetical protein